MKKVLAMLISISLVMLMISGVLAETSSSDDEGTSVIMATKTIGVPNAPVKMVMYTDFQDPYSARWYSETYPKIAENYIEEGKLRLTIKHFPFSFHANAYKASIAAQCAAEQGEFFDYIELLYANQGSLSEENLAEYANSIGLDMDAFYSCNNDDEIEEKVDSDIEEGNDLGITGTPTFFINDEIIVGGQPYSNFKKMIDEAIGTSSQVIDFKVTLDPKNQETVDGSAKYRIIIEDLREDETLTEKIYKISFEGNNNLEGELSEKEISLFPGESESIILKVETETQGTQEFNVKTELEKSYVINTKGTITNKGSSSIPVPEDNDLVEVTILPESQNTETGKATYTVTILDKHHATGLCEVGTNCKQEVYNYRLTFYSSAPITGELEQKTISLEAGEKETVNLEVQAKEKGQHTFLIKAIGDETMSSARGKIVYNGETEPSTNTAFFQGDGFAISEDETQGELVKLHILNDETLKGKMSFGEENYRIDGNIENNELHFNIYEISDSAQITSIGEFNGKLEKFSTFLKLNGNIIFETNIENSNWELTAISKRKSIFQTIETIELKEKPLTRITKIEEVIVIEPSIETGKTSEGVIEITPKEWKNKYWIFGPKVLEVEIASSDKTIKKNLEPFEEESFGNYQMKVESTESEEEIEITIETK